ncbi:MAG: ABC transporter substrate-binding protein, partial [Thermoanaerobaculia bacterium]
IPIVMVQAGDPVGSGLVASLARPGGNITGSTNLSEGLAAKRLQLLKEVVPAASRVAVFFDPKPPFARRVLLEIEAAAPALGVRIQPVPVSTPDDLALALTALSRDLPSALLEIESQVGLIHRRQIIDFAIKHRLPAIYPFRWSVVDGGLMAYEASLTALFRRAGYFVDRILKGTPPGELPVEQPTKFDFILNMRTAKAIGLTFPRSVLLRADEIIE